MTELIQPVTFNYNKISDDIMYLGDCMIVKFNTVLAKKDKYGERQPYHKEFEYGPRHNRRGSIKRVFDFNVSIENYKPSITGYKDQVNITMSDMYKVRFGLNTVFKWFFDPAYAKMYVQKGPDIILMNRPDRVEIPVSFGKAVIFEASIFIDSSGTKQPGVRLYLNNVNNFTDFSVDKFLALKYFLDNLNMYESAQLMLNYIQRPELGTNTYSLPSEEDSISLKEKDVDYKEGRQIPGKPRSFFDKVDNEMK